MTKATNIKTIETKTGKSWNEWLQFFESINAKELSHHEIAKKVHEAGTPGWWSQMVTVAYEQHIGRRAPGQDNKGGYSVSVSKTIDGDKDDALQAWLKAVDSLKQIEGVVITRGPETTQSEKWRYWHCGLEDGSRVDVGMYDKAPGKATLGLAHEKLSSETQAESLRIFWKDFLDKL